MAGGGVLKNGKRKAVSHAALRLAERYGVELTKGEMGALIQRMRNGEGVLLDRRPDAERRLVKVAGREVVVLWGISSGHIISVLPLKRKLPAVHRVRNKGARRGREGRRPELTDEIE